MQEFLKAHYAAILFGSYWVFSAAVGAMPMPTDKSGPFYQWAFKFLNTVAANVSRAFSAKGLPAANGSGK